MLKALECIPKKGASMPGLKKPESGGDPSRDTGRGNSTHRKALGENVASVGYSGNSREASRLVDAYSLKLMMLACRLSRGFCLVSQDSGSSGDAKRRRECAYSAATCFLTVRRAKTGKMDEEKCVKSSGRAAGSHQDKGGSCLTS